MGSVQRESAVKMDLNNPLFFCSGVGVISPADQLDFLETTPTWSKFWKPVLDRLASTSSTPEEDLEVLKLIAIQTSLIDVWKSWGICPSAVAGHSLGELSAAYAAGIYSLEDVRDVGLWIAEAMRPQLGWMASGYNLKASQDAHLASTNFKDHSGLHETYCGKTTDQSFDVFMKQNPEAKKLFVKHAWHHPRTVKPLHSSFPVISSNHDGAPSMRVPFFSSLKKCYFNGNLDETYWTEWLTNPCDVLTMSEEVLQKANLMPPSIIEIGAHPISSSFFPKAHVTSSMNRTSSTTALNYIVRQAAPLLMDRIIMEIRSLFPSFRPEIEWLSQGMNSVTLTQTAKLLAKYYPNIQPADFYACRTLKQLSEDYGAAKQVSTTANLQRQNLTSSQISVVIAGVGCWLPGSIHSPAAAFDFFHKKGDAITKDAQFSTHPCGYMDDFPFHFTKFKIRPNEARVMDPQQQLALFVSDMAVTDSQIAPEKLAGPRTGVYFGAWNQDFQGVQESAYDVVGSNPSIISSRVSSHWDLRGPSVLINTACASSLECVVRAMDDLRLGKVDYALVGGVNVIHDPSFTDRMKRGGFLGDSARCKTFDSEADGYVRSEGAVVMVLAREDVLGNDAEKNTSKHFYASLIGGASNHNGYSPLITVPSAAAQAELIVTACQDANISPLDLDSIECHGTGTRIGDPIEVDGIVQAVGQKREKPLFLGSSKTNVGHLESAAGATGLLRAVLSLQSQVVFGNPQLKALNAGCKFPPFMVPARDTTNAKMSCVGISSFGFGGSNAHIIVAKPGAKNLGNLKVVTPESEEEFFFVRKSARNRSAGATTHGETKMMIAPADDSAKYRTLVSMVEAMGYPGGNGKPLLELGMDSMAITDLFLQITNKFGTSNLDVPHIVGSGMNLKQVSDLIAGGGVVAEDPDLFCTPVPDAEDIPSSAFVPGVEKISGAAAREKITQRSIGLLKAMGHKELDPSTTLIDLGMDSLSITDYVMQVNRMFNTNLNVGEITEANLQKISHIIVSSGNYDLSPGGTASVTTAATSADHVAELKKRSSRQNDQLEASDYYLTRPYVRCQKKKILTTHVGSLPASFGSSSYDHIFQQVDIGLDIINDGEVKRKNYIDEVFGRLSGFRYVDEHAAAYMPLDVAECPSCARRFMGKSSLITLNKRYPAINPCCVGPITYTNDTEIKEYLTEFAEALRLNGTDPESAFYSCPSPGTLALFFKNAYYATEEEYLQALAMALSVEYTEIVRRGFILQIDCPDLAMGRHTQHQRLSDREYIQQHRKLIQYLNMAVAHIPKSRIRVHICWGNYGFSHHRDISLDKIVDNLNEIHCGELLIENANPRHNHEIDAMSKIHSAIITLGCVDTCAPHVENPNLIARRLVKLAQMVGPERVKAGTDCGFATTAESNSNTEIVFMKFRSLVMGARIASSILFNGVSLFVPRSQARLYWFGEKPTRMLPNYEIRHCPLESLEADRVARHMRSYTDLPVFFVDAGYQGDKAKLAELKQLLEGTAAYPEETIVTHSCDEVMYKVKNTITFDRSKLKIKSRFLGTAHPKREYDVVIVGAGLTGLHVAHEMLEAGVDFCLLEKESGIGGIWKHYANERSQVNTSEAAYRLFDKVNTNKDHSTTREILTDSVTVAERIGDRLFLQAQVAHVDKTPNGVYETTLANGALIKSRGCIMAINDRVGFPRAVKWENQDVFSGEIRCGFSNDAADLDWVGKRVVIVGMGAFATENLRTAMECGAKSVTILARRHGTVCPKYIDYINFVNKSPERLDHDSVTNTKNMYTWLDLYEKTAAKMPECWLGAIKHYGHTISVSDIWFIAHHLRILDSLADEVSYFVEDGIITKENGFLPADIVIRCTGFERNAQLIPKLTPYKHVNSCNYLDNNFMYLADALIDDNVFNSVFGSSVMEMARMFCAVYLYFWRNPNDYEAVKNELAVVPVEDRKWSNYIAGLDLLYQRFEGVRDIASKQIRDRHAAFLKAHTVEEYMKENRREWNELHNILGVWSEETGYLAYPKWSSSATSN